MEATSSPTLYEQLGGAPAVDAAVDVFYRKVLSDDRVSQFFDDVRCGAADRARAGVNGCLHRIAGKKGRS